MTATAAKETHGFQTEVRQLLDLMIHSLYGNKEIFLRELISNASDAADKLRFEALSNDALYEGDGELQIRVDYDKNARTLSVSDNGVGLGYQEAIDNLGTIAKSGTQQFLQSLTGDQAADTRLIGQFGVGFYSSFMVADRVTVTTRRAGLGAEEGVRWESTGEGEYTIEHLEVPARGTTVVLHLREDQDELLDGFRLRSIVRQHSDYIAVPILMKKEGGDEQEQDESDERVNSATALWARAKNEISADEYNEFYKHIAHDFEDPLAHVHSRVEGTLEYTSLLFIPQRAPFDAWDRNVRRGVNLYVRRVFIMDDAEQLMPPYLRFVRGVIDSADLPLNISREILQQNKQIDSIRAGSVKKVLDLLSNMAKKEKEKYATFWKEFGRMIKEGIIDDPKNNETISKLLRFASTHGDGEEQTVSLADYVERMQEGQKKIYYVTADNYAMAKNSPHLEVFHDRGIEVLLLTDNIDEWFVNHLTEYEGKPLQSVSKGELDLGTSAETGQDDKDKSETQSDHSDVVEKLKVSLGERVKDVRVTARLTTSPACLVADEHEMGSHMERVLKSAGQQIEAAKPVMEINADHLVIKRFADETDEKRCKDWANILFDQALLSEGGRLDDPARFVKTLNEMFLYMAQGAAPAKAAASGSAEKAQAPAKKKTATHKETAAKKKTAANKETAAKKKTAAHKDTAETKKTTANKKTGSKKATDKTPSADE